MCLLQFQKEYLKTDLHDAAMVLICFAQNAMNKFKYSFCEKYLLLKEVCKEVNSTFFTHLCDLCISLFEKYICTDVTEINLYKSLSSTFFFHDLSSQMRQEGQGLTGNWFSGQLLISSRYSVRIVLVIL